MACSGKHQWLMSGLREDWRYRGVGIVMDQTQVGKHKMTTMSDIANAKDSLVAIIMGTYDVEDPQSEAIRSC